MDESSAADIQAEAVRIQRLLEETVERAAGDSEDARGDALEHALRGSVATLPAPLRAAVLETLDRLYGGAAMPGSDARLQKLEAENAHLREELAGRTAVPAGDAALAIALTEVLLGSSRSTGPLIQDAASEERLVAVIRVLVGFVSELVRSYLGATLDPDRTMAGRLGSVLADEIRGTIATGSVAAMIARIRQQIGGQILAFREACDSGTHDLLRQLAPAALAAGATSGSVRLLGARPFYYRECWESFEKKYEELRTADNLYEAYFDGAFRKALHRVARGAESTKGGQYMKEGPST